MIKKLLYLAIILALVSLMTGCGMQNPHKIAKVVKSSIQKSFDTEPEYANLHPQLKDLQLEMIDTNHYKGIAKVEVKGKTYNCELNIETEGKMVNWEPVEGNFEFMY